MRAVAVGHESDFFVVVFKACGKLSCKSARNRVAVIKSHPYIVEKSGQTLREFAIIEGAKVVARLDDFRRKFVCVVANFTVFKSACFGKPAVENATVGLFVSK